MWSRIWIVLAALLVALAGCGGEDSDNSGRAPTGWGEDGSDEGGSGDPGPGSGDPGPGTGDEGSSGGDGDTGGPSDSPGGGGEGQGGSGGSTTQPGQLTAGEWRDLDHWEYWLELMEGQSRAYVTKWGFDTSGRIPVVVHDEGAAITDAALELMDGQGRVIWRARTDAWGEAELFAGLFDRAEGPFNLRASSGDATATTSIPADFDGTTLRLDVELGGAAVPPAVLDVAFLVDTTGSMGDELHYLQTELGDVIERVRDGQEQTQIRVGLGFYRDEGDEYVVRNFPFTTDVDLALGHLAAQSANGGGDYEEAVEQGLDAMITQGQWSDAARARLLFVVLDAPPHHRDPIVAKMQQLSAAAAERGIRVVAVGASGVDRTTEFLMRLLGITTGGTYTFLTDHSGIGNPHLEPTVGEYQVELLNDLLVRVISESLGE